MPVEPFTSFNFRIEVALPDVEGMLFKGAFSECQGLEMSMEAKTIREGGNNARPVHLVGPVSYSQLTLKRGMSSDLALWVWFDRTQRERSLRAECDVYMLAPNRKDTTLHFGLKGCLPVKIKAPALQAKDGQIAIEEMQLLYESLTIEPGRNESD